jgi:hypothetical protein
MLLASIPVELEIEVNQRAVKKEGEVAVPE